MLGVDPASSAVVDAGPWISDPDKKFRSLQMAIDALQNALVANHDPQNNPDQQGIVHALPGLYGPHGSLGSGDTLPIHMRDRVHVEGSGARRCVIRGGGAKNVTDLNFPETPNVPPPPPTPTQPPPREVLVTFELAPSDTPVIASLPMRQLPWFTTPTWSAADVVEVLDGFTFEGGDVQVLFRSRTQQPSVESSGRVSNCVFDMRHGWEAIGGDLVAVPVAGPYFGVLMTSRSATMSPTTNVVGYLDTPAFIAHNTFILAQWGLDGQAQGWTEESRDEAVAIAEVSYASALYPNIDCDTMIRGLANPLIVGNVFRTRPPRANQSVLPFAMLGVSDDDALVWNGSGWVQTNAFDPSRVGSTNGWFYSVPVQSFVVETGAQNSIRDIWNGAVNSNGGIGNTSQCGQQQWNYGTVASPPSVPAVAIWDGATGLDPAFVGEFLCVAHYVANSRLLHYRDWRILPGSPLEDLGMKPYAGTARTLYRRLGQAVSQPQLTAVATSPNMPEGQLDLFGGWDGEHWGNPRVVGSQPDIGFDERHVLICAGSWANDTNSHNASGFMSPHASSMTAQRYFILPEVAGGYRLDLAGAHVTIFQTIQTPVAPDPGPGWVNPPQTLPHMPKLSTLPVGYRTKYIAMESASGYWTKNVGLSSYSGSYLPPGLALSLSFRLIADVVDDECSSGACTHSYFNMQAFAHDASYNPQAPVAGSEWLRSNLQAEYR